MRYLALLTLLLLPSLVYAGPPNTGPEAAASAPSPAGAADAPATAPAPSTAATLAQPGALPGLPTVTLPEGYVLVPKEALATSPAMPDSPALEVPTPPPSAETPWWQGLLQNPQAWGILLMLAFALWKHFDLQGATKAQAILNEAASVAYGATEEAKRLGDLGIGGVTETFIRLFTDEMKASGQKVTEDAVSKALRRAKSINAAAKAGASPGPTPAPSAP